MIIARLGRTGGRAGQAFHKADHSQASLACEARHGQACEWEGLAIPSGGVGRLGVF